MKAIILAGGRGERLLPLTGDRPKCLVEVAGRPIIAHQLEWLAVEGVDEVIVSCGYRWQAIQDFVGDGASLGLKVRYAVEEEPLGRGGGLRKAMGELQEPRPVLALNGDLIVAVHPQEMLAQHVESEAAVTLLLVPFVSQHGIVELDASGKVSGFREKPPLPYWVSGGVYVMSPEVYDLLPERGDHEDAVWPRLAQEGRMGGFQFKGFWRSLDSPKDVSEADRALRARV